MAALIVVILVAAVGGGAAYVLWRASQPLNKSTLKAEYWDETSP